MSEEKWLPVLGYEGLYEVSDLGSVRSFDRRNSRGELRKGRILKSWLNSDGYPTVKLYKAGQSPVTVHVHQLILEAFVGPRPEGMEVCHNDGVRSNSVLSNLRWDTRSANSLDKVRHGNDHHASRSACKYGHPYDEKNTHQSPRGGRICRRCNAIRAYYKRRLQGIPARKPPPPDLADVIFGLHATREADQRVRLERGLRGGER